MARREQVDFNEHHPIHDSIFGIDPDGLYNDTPRGAIGENVNMRGVAVQSDRDLPLRHMGDTDQSDMQPSGSYRN